MGLIRAISGATRSQLADQWKEYIHAESLDADVLLCKGTKVTGRTQFGTSNTRGSDDVITNGSKIAVNEGQAMLIVEDGKVVEFCCEPGGFIYDSGSEPSLFTGKLGDSLINTFKEIGKRFTYGGDTGKTQRVYYINTKEIVGNKFGSSSPVPYDDPYYKTVLYIRYFGSYSIRIQDPLRFYSALAGNVTSRYTVSQFIEQCNDEFYTALDSTLNSIALEGVKFSMLPSKQRELARFMNETLDDEWVKLRGIVVESVGINKVTPDDKSRSRIEEFDNATMLGGNTAAMQGRMVGAQAKAFENMGNNKNGVSGMDMMGMAFGAQAMQSMTGGMFNQNMRQPVNQNTSSHVTDDTEIDLSNTWTCKCGAVCDGKFCKECGATRPVETKQEVKSGNTWTCSCGAICDGKFCKECGAKKPEEPVVKHFRCDKCGWEPEDNTKPPKFCPECGDKFDFNDEV